ncbi:hypothetical protein M408DRAFT_191465 [Serendipita vermifera MAFF 305830]|uniref:Poly(A) RNA polymerase mitochondrial-like central palm domain-containing protein n=1 Tax=Serendipita vermifera MAFF 305830 TaxID=933852 RepID=A0A0C2X4L3_SERVB|nr:hypothetical protein M408DRAFT_191465 [Serendipita vermifera MAFF 305830]
MLELYKLTRPTPEVQRHREQTIAELKRILTNRFGPQYVPALFGSSRYGVSDRQSDLDIVILDQDHPHGFTPTVYDRTLPALYKLSDLAQLLRKKRYGKVIVIPAKVPIIKARDPKTNLQIDININDRLGLFNTELLEHYCMFWPPLSNLIYVIKKWAKVRGLNEPAGLKKAGPTFSSYCLTLMIVGFLQSRGILPNLHEQRPTNQQDRPYFWIKINKNSRMKCWVDWNHLSPSAWTPANNPSLGRAFYAWLQLSRVVRS